MSELMCGFPIIRTDFIYKAIESLYKYTPVDFRVFVVDQSVEGIDKEFVKKYVHWYVRPYQNLGFAKAANEMLWTGYRQGYPYLAICNDDIEYINSDWWQGIKDEFATNERIMVVNPESPRVPLWGYGRNHDEYIDIVPYKEEYTKEDWEFLKSGNYDRLLNEYHKEPVGLPLGLDGKPDWKGNIYIPNSFPLTKRGVIDGIAMWHPVFKREALEKIGYFDERFMYGGGEDYDYNCRGYRLKYRLVSSMKSWVWHWWGKSKDKVSELPPELFNRPFWNSNEELWPRDLNEGFTVDPWGFYTSPTTGERQPLRRVPEVRIDSL